MIQIPLPRLIVFLRRSPYRPSGAAQFDALIERATSLERPAGSTLDIAMRLLGVASGEHAYPEGPFRALMRSGVNRAFQCCADLVTIVPDLDNLRMLGPIADLEPDEVRELAADLCAQLCDQNFELRLADDGTGYLDSDRSLRFVAYAPGSLAGERLREAMPAGPDGARIRALQSEIGMLLHGHRVNRDRERAGRVPVNALWFWGSGVLPPGERIELPGLVAVDDALQGLWRHAGQRARVAMTAVASDDRGFAQVGVISIDNAEIESYALAALQSGRLSRDCYLVPDCGPIGHLPRRRLRLPRLRLFQR